MELPIESKTGSDLLCFGGFDKLPEIVNSLISCYSSTFYLFIVILIYGATNFMSGKYLTAFCVYCPLIGSHRESAAIYISDRSMVLAKNSKIPKPCPVLCCRAIIMGWLLPNPLE